MPMMMWPTTPIIAANDSSCNVAESFGSAATWPHFQQMAKRKTNLTRRITEPGRNGKFLFQANLIQGREIARVLNLD